MVVEIYISLRKGCFNEGIKNISQHKREKSQWCDDGLGELQQHK